jgi:hypothetical protein
MVENYFASAGFKDFLSAHTRHRNLLVILVAMLLALSLAS